MFLLSCSKNNVRHFGDHYLSSRNQSVAQTCVSLHNEIKCVCWHQVWIHQTSQVSFCDGNDNLILFQVALYFITPQNRPHHLQRDNHLHSSTHWILRDPAATMHSPDETTNNSAISHFGFIKILQHSLSMTNTQNEKLHLLLVQINCLWHMYYLSHFGITTTLTYHVLN